jgi:hypothetical protein
VKVKNIKPPPHWQGLSFHPFSELTEFGLGIDSESMIDHMAQNGWDPSERVTLYEGKILDGRHKHDAAKKAEVEPLFQEFHGSQTEALAFVKKKLLRQHLTTDQRAMVAATLATLANGCRPSSKDEGGGMTREQAAAECGTNTTAVDRAKALLTKCIPSIQRAYRTGKVSLTDAASVADQSRVRQEKALDAVQTGKVSTLAGWVKKNPVKPKVKKTAKVELKDRTGRVVPNCCRDVFADTSLAKLIDELEAARTDLDHQGWTNRANNLCDHFGFILIQKFVEHVQNAAEEMQLALESLRAGEPYAVCPSCNGEKKDCRTCRGFGYVPEFRWQELQKESE